MNRLRKKRQWSAWLLLCIFVPMLLIASLHEHRQDDAPIADCYSCLHHICHDGHLSADTYSLDNCVLCQFLALPFVAAIAVSLVFTPILRHAVSSNVIRNPRTGVYGITSLRAPPCLFE